MSVKAIPDGPRPRTVVAIAAAVIAAVILALYATDSAGGAGHHAGAPAGVPALTSWCHPGPSGAKSWLMGAGEYAMLRAAAPASLRHAVGATNLYLSRGRQTPVPARQRVDDFTSYAVFARAAETGAISPGTRWVMYDNERWRRTPASEQARPVHYERLFAQLAHRLGYRVILAPAQDLVPGFSKAAFRAGRAAWPKYVSMGLASASARLADVYEIQAQPYELPGYRHTHAYLNFVRAAAQRARAANPRVVVLAGLSTQRVTGARQLLADFLATRGLVAGYWLNIPHHDQPGPLLLAGRFLRDIPAASAAAAGGCGRA